MNIRRKLLVALGASALAAPFPAFAQQPGKVWRIGFLSQRYVDSLDSDAYSGLPKGLRELGYVEGRNLVIEWRYANGALGRLPGLAAELVKLNVDVIVAAGSPSISAAQKATTIIPIVIGTTTTNPIQEGFVASLARPGGNITGVYLPIVELGAKLLEMLLAVTPGLSRVAILVNPVTQEATVPANVQAIAQKAGVSLLTVEARNLEEIESAFLAMRREKIEAFMFVSSSVFMQHRRRIVKLAAERGLPFLSSYREYAEAGGLMTYGPSLGENYRRAATYVDRIFKGANPGDLPVEQPTAFELFINRKTAAALGLTIPQSIMASATKVIE